MSSFMPSRPRRTRGSSLRRGRLTLPKFGHPFKNAEFAAAWNTEGAALSRAVKAPGFRRHGQFLRAILFSPIRDSKKSGRRAGPGAGSFRTAAGTDSKDWPSMPRSGLTNWPWPGPIKRRLPVFAPGFIFSSGRIFARLAIVAGATGRRPPFLSQRNGHRPPSRSAESRMEGDPRSRTEGELEEALRSVTQY